MRIFFPIRSIDVPSRRDPRISYRVALGHEHWDTGPHVVYKVQVVYDGAVQGRRSPSFPAGTDDWDRVVKAMASLKKGAGALATGQVDPV